MKKKLLMIDPHFPVPRKSIYNHTTLPIGLLKIGTWYQLRGWDVQLVRLAESDEPIDYSPNKIIITSIFTYWSKYVKDAVDWARKHYDAPIEVGGVFASLQPQLCKEVTGCDTVHVGVMKEAEGIIPNYSLLNQDIDYQILHTSRGCQRRCNGCGVYYIEPHQTFISSIKDQVFKRKLLFYDNNLLANPHIERILSELIALKKQKKILSCESQSGFDGRILRRKPHLATKLRRAGFVYPKIAWDGSVRSWKKRKEEIDILKDAGFRGDHISVFMLCNHDLKFAELETKRMFCFEWGVQVNPCRFRPLDQLCDNYNSWKRQTGEDYFIHPNWTDDKIKQFIRNTRRHNICVRFRLKYYNKNPKPKEVSKEFTKSIKYMKYSEVLKYLNDVWNPQEFHMSD